MPHLLTTPQWHSVQRWLDGLHAWMKKRSTGTVKEANTVFHPNAQTWFNDGVGAINACLQPLLVHEFAIALRGATPSIDTIHQMLVDQDLAWQPDPRSTHCISGAFIWATATGTMAVRTGWNMAELAMREPALTAILGQFKRGASPEVDVWLRDVCMHNAWAQETTFHWLVQQDAPESLRWAFEAQEYPSDRAMEVLVQACLQKNTPDAAKRWEQCKLWQPELADFIERSILVHKELGLVPRNRLATTIAQAWRQSPEADFSIESSVFDERP